MDDVVRVEKWPAGITIIIRESGDLVISDSVSVQTARRLRDQLMCVLQIEPVANE